MKRPILTNKTRDISLPIEVVFALQAELRKASRDKTLNVDKRRRFKEFARLLKLELKESNDSKVKVPSKLLLGLLKCLSWILQNRGFFKQVIDAMLDS